MNLVECVPNISEGQHPERIREIARAAEVRGASLLHVDTGYAANRTVLTFAGGPEAVVEGAFGVIQRSVELLDLRTHRGAHPRVGATDVCPFVPLFDTPMEVCIECARVLGARVAEALSLPVYFYEAAASTAERRRLPYLRQGGFEGLDARKARPELYPDLGPTSPHPTAGAVIIGARPILIAYNVHLATKSVEIASQIAGELRASGRTVNGVRVPGALPAVRAIGWYIDEYECAEVSFNLLDYRITGMYEAFTATVNAAARLGTEVRGSEVIGLLPREALAAVGARVFAQGGNDPYDEERYIEAGIEYLKLNEMRPFSAADKTIEARLLAAGLL